MRASLVLFVAVGAMACARHAGLERDGTTGAVTGKDLASLVRTALQERTRAGDIPDFGILPDRQVLLVRREMPQAHQLLPDDALPRLPSPHFAFIAAQTARELSSREGREVFFLGLDRPRITGSNAEIWMGVDFERPAATAGVKTCCCTSPARYHWSGNNWQFAGWGDGVCY